MSRLAKISIRSENQMRIYIIDSKGDSGCREPAGRSGEPVAVAHRRTVRYVARGSEAECNGFSVLTQGRVLSGRRPTDL